MKSLSTDLFLDIFEGVPKTEISKEEIFNGIPIIDALVEKSGFLKSNGEARRAINENSISLNKSKVKLDTIINTKDLIDGKYLLLQRGKKNYFVILVA